MFFVFTCGYKDQALPVLPSSSPDASKTTWRDASAAISEAKHCGVTRTLIEQAKLKLRLKHRKRQEQEEARFFRCRQGSGDGKLSYLAKSWREGVE